MDTIEHFTDACIRVRFETIAVDFIDKDLPRLQSISVDDIRFFVQEIMHIRTTEARLPTSLAFDAEELFEAFSVSDYASEGAAVHPMFTAMHIHASCVEAADSCRWLITKKRHEHFRHQR